MQLSLLNNNDTCPLNYRRCGRCSVSSAVVKLNPIDLYGEKYNFFSGASENYVNYSKELALNLNSWGLLNGKRVLEIACNDGTLSKELIKYGCTLTGVDPFTKAIESLDKANSATIINDFFNVNLIKEHSLEASFDLVIVSNVISHVLDFHDFMIAISKVVAAGGFIYAENMNYHRVLEEKRFENFYHGVYNLLSPDEFNNILSKSFTIFSDMGPGFDPNSNCFLLKKVQDNSELLWEGNIGPKLTQSYLDDWIIKLNNWAIENISEDNAVGYGANSKAGLMIAKSKHLRDRLSVVLDINISKAGSKIAGTEVFIKNAKNFNYKSTDKIILFAPHLKKEVEEFLISKGFKGDLCTFNTKQKKKV